jgi:hypothetical protein
VHVTEELRDGGAATSITHTLGHGAYAYFPADHAHKITSVDGASLLVYEKPYVVGLYKLSCIQLALGLYAPGVVTQTLEL